MTCCKCNRVHPRFKNGKLKKTCPNRKRRVKRKVKRIKGQIKGKGKITDTIKRMAIDYAKKQGKEYLARKGLSKGQNKASKQQKWGTPRESKNIKYVKW
jgi:hypothetical protein